MSMLSISFFPNDECPGWFIRNYMFLMNTILITKSKSRHLIIIVPWNQAPGEDFIPPFRTVIQGGPRRIH